MPAGRFDVTVSFEGGDDARAAAAAILDAFGESVASVAPASTVSASEDRVVVHFHELTDEVPPHGEEMRPPRPDATEEAAGREAIERLEALHREPTAVLPIVRALVAVSAARARAGLSPRQRITIEVEPAPVHTQEELRHS